MFSEPDFYFQIVDILSLQRKLLQEQTFLISRTLRCQSGVPCELSEVSGVREGVEHLSLVVDTVYDYRL